MATKDTQLAVPDENTRQQALAVVSTAQYALIEMDSNELHQLIQDNLGGEQLTPFDFDRIKVPAGGGLTWQDVPSPEGPTDAKAVEGVIVAWTQPRVYWKEAYGGSGGTRPPDCQSVDGQIGIGDPGGACATCPYAQFGSAKKPDGSPGRGQACKQTRLLFMIQEDNILPVVVVCPPTSVRKIKDHFRGLLSMWRTPFFGAVTSLTLERVGNADGVNYARVAPRVLGKLSPVEAAKFAAYRAQLLPVISQMPVDLGDMEPSPTTSK